VVCNKERGFSMIELLTVVTIVALLSKLALTSFVIYRGKAEYSKAVSLYQSARTASTAGEGDVGDSFEMAFTESTDNGAPLAGSLRDYFPRLPVPENVVLGASVTPCAGSGIVPNVVISVKPCRGDGKHIEYVRFCNGFDTVEYDAAGNGC